MPGRSSPQTSPTSKPQPQKCFPRPRGGICSHGRAARCRASNARALEAWRIVPRMFIDRAERDLSATILGVEMPAPVILGPIAGQALAHPDAEAATARAAAALGLTYVHSSLSSTSVEGVAVAAPQGSRWFAMDWPDARPRPRAAGPGAERTGCTHLVLSPPQPGKGWAALRRSATPGTGRYSQRHPDRAGRAGGGPPWLRRHRRFERARAPAFQADGDDRRPATDRERGRRKGSRPIRLGRPNGAPMPTRRWPWGPRRSSSAARTCTDWRSEGKLASGTCSAHSSRSSRSPSPSQGSRVTASLTEARSSGTERAGRRRVAMMCRFAWKACPSGGRTPNVRRP